MIIIVISYIEEGRGFSKIGFDFLGVDFPNRIRMS